ncbi:MAG: ATP-binding cassette domain-containing protein [Dactylosporangium sp.]|nr:ATP-binding cassette domain-containing protein [Dactylosporangium sp.]NNJ61437.1 ATP-binding cassette domain-containing protein [Dactylosporangium sp.]
MRMEDVWLRYGRRGSWVLAGADLTLGAGEVAIVLGRNGAGKSTLLQVAAGVLPLSRGAVHDRPPTVGWVPERFPADQPFTVRTYLEAMAAVRGLKSAATEIERWAERLAFGPHLDERLSNLSKGTAQKVGLAQALLVPPGLLVLDEPWEGLDAQTREEVPDIVTELIATGGTVLVSDHRGEMARLPGASMWHLDGGQISPAKVASTRRWVVEVAVAAADPSAAVARLHAAGHEILGVREGVRR